MDLAIHFIWFYMVIIQLSANLEEKPDYNAETGFIGLLVSWFLLWGVETRFIAFPRSLLLQLK